MYLKTILFLGSFIICKSWADPIPDPDPDAQAEALPQAEPQAEAQYFPNNGFYQPQSQYPQSPYPGMGYPQMGQPSMGQPSFGQPSMGQPPMGRPPMNSCQMTDECCGMADQNCCPENAPQPECQTYYERVCSPDTQVRCPIRVEKYCVKIDLPACRNVQQIVKRTFRGQECSKQPVNKCFDIDVEDCDSGTQDNTATVSWENQQLNKEGEETKTYCKNIQYSKCENYTTTKVVTNPQRIPYTVNITTQNCRMEMSPTSQVIRVPINKPRTVRRCYNMPVTQCSQVPCATTGTCNTGSYPCEFQQQQVSVCPDKQPGQQPGPCQNVQQPICNQGMASCGNQYQQCCKTQYRQTCRDEVIYDTEYEERTVTGPNQYRRVCDPQVTPQVRYRIESKPRTVTVTKSRCKPAMERKCHEYTIPKYSVKTKQEVGTVTVPVPTCSKKMRTVKKCVTVPDGKVVCRDRTFERSIRVTKNVCDQIKRVDRCFDVGVTDCQEYPGVDCQMVPRQYCPQTCNRSDYCNRCTEFVNNPGAGFGSCPTSTCPNYFGNMQNGNFPQALAQEQANPGVTEINLVSEDQMTDDIYN